jgi:sec-independent protein translocase protein TatB
MLGSLSWDRLFMLLVTALIVLGPERLPAAVRRATHTLRQVRDQVNRAADQARTEFGPELAEMREPLAMLAETHAQLRVLTAPHLRDLTTAPVLVDPPHPPPSLRTAPAPAPSAHPAFDPQAT